MEKENKKFNLFKLLQNVAVVGLFLVIGLGILFGTNLLPRTMGAIEFTIMVGLALIGVLLVLPWAKYLEEKQYKIVSLIFLISTAVCVLLWEISTLLIFGAIRSENANKGMLHLIRITLLISFQVVIASFIGKFVIKYHTKYIPFQAITYLSMVYIDFWLSTLLFGGSINKGFEVVPETLNIVWNRTAGALMILACVYLITSLTVISNARRRRVRNSILGRGRIVNRDIGLMDLNDDDDDELEPKANLDQTEVQLEKIKAMFDKGLITKEEYDAKRQAIIEKI